ncbi:MAG: hypothetical protein Q8P22_09920 [Chloroflexota bacterium]|nr:hypothetical protein [Chloroflexota bacterium]
MSDEARLREGMMFLSVLPTWLVKLIAAALAVTLLALSAACAPVATPTPTATATPTSVPAPPATATPTSTPTAGPIATPTRAPNPFATGTPTPPSTPTPTPTISVAPADLPPAARTPDLERRLEVIGRWEPVHPGAFQTLAEGQSKGKRYVFLGKENRLDLLEIASEGPPKPTGVSIALAGRPSEMAWEGDTLLTVVWAQDAYALQVWDVSDVRRPKPVGSLPGVDRLFDVDGRRAYVSRREDPGKDAAYLIPDITRPSESVKLEGFYVVNGVKGAGNLAYVLWTPVPTARNEPLITVLDVSASGSPYVVGEYVVGELEGVYATRGALADGRLFLWGDSWGLSVLDVGDAPLPLLLSEPPRGPRTVSTVDIDDSVSVLVDGTHLYLLLYGGDWGVYRWRLQVWDVSDPAQPKEVSGIEGRGVPAGMWRQGEQIVVADWYGFTVVDVSDPANIGEVERVPSGASPVAIYLRSGYAYLFLQSGLFVLDLSRAESPQLAAFRDLKVVHGTHDYGERFQVAADGAPHGYEVDVSDPKAPKVKAAESSFPPNWGQPVGSYFYRASCGAVTVEDAARGHGQDAQVARIRLADSICAERWHLAALGRYVYVVGNGRLYLFDASEPAAPRVLAEKALVGDGEQTSKEQAYIVIADGRAYVLHGGLWVLDLSAPLQPKEVAYYPTDALTLDVEGDRIALVGPDGTFELLKLER